MAIDKKYIYAKTLAGFKKELDAGNIKDTSIVYIKDTLLIWTHGQYFGFSDAPANNNSYVRKNNGWALAPSSGIEIYIGENLPSSDYKVWIDTREGSLYYYNNEWKELFAANPIDLSVVDIYGNSRDTATTANCYVVKKAGTYRIPLVYGNAIVNGLTNSASYTEIAAPTSLSFMNGNGNTINTPFIEKQIIINSALLSIADTDEIFSDIGIWSNPNVTSINNCGYILFKINSIPDTGANGVISIKDSNGTIIWNWHIWIWTDDLTPVSITNSTGVTYKILPYNLASKWDNLNKIHIKNWFYQWGRSVPMLCPKTYDSSLLHLYYGALKPTNTYAQNSYSYGILYPNTFYYNDSKPYNWFGTSTYDNLWDANYAFAGTGDNVTVKTVYDPCPPGFKIPNGNTFTGFGDYNGGSWSNGYTWSGTFFPASGSLGYSRGHLEGVGSLGLCWTSANAEALGLPEYKHCLYFSSGYNNVLPQHYSHCACGNSVRPVAEL